MEAMTKAQRKKLNKFSVIRGGHTKARSTYLKRNKGYFDYDLDDILNMYDDQLDVINQNYDKYEQFIQFVEQCGYDWRTVFDIYNDPALTTVKMDGYIYASDAFDWKYDDMDVQDIEKIRNLRWADQREKWSQNNYAPKPVRFQATKILHDFSNVQRINRKKILAPKKEAKPVNIDPTIKLQNEINELRLIVAQLSNPKPKPMVDVKLEAQTEIVPVKTEVKVPIVVQKKLCSKCGSAQVAWTHFDSNISYCMPCAISLHPTVIEKRPQTVDEGFRLQKTRKAAPIHKETAVQQPKSVDSIPAPIKETVVQQPQEKTQIDNSAEISFDCSTCGFTSIRRGATALLIAKLAKFGKPLFCGRCVRERIVVKNQNLSAQPKPIHVVTQKVLQPVPIKENKTIVPSTSVAAASNVSVNTMTKVLPTLSQQNFPLLKSVGGFPLEKQQPPVIDPVTKTPLSLNMANFHYQSSNHRCTPIKTYFDSNVGEVFADDGSYVGAFSFIRWKTQGGPQAIKILPHFWLSAPDDCLNLVFKGPTGDVSIGKVYKRDWIQHPDREFGVITDPMIVKNLYSKASSAGLKTVAISCDVPLDSQIYVNVRRGEDYLASMAYLKKIDSFYVVANSTEDGDCGRAYYWNNKVIGYHIGTFGKNMYNVLVCYAEVSPWLISLNL
jgi:hypothetical protein